MTLPLPRFQDPVFEQGDKGFSKRWLTWLGDLVRLANGAIVDGQLIESVSLNAFVDNVIPHTLGRDLKGCAVVKEAGVNCYVDAGLLADQTGLSTGVLSPIAYDDELYDDGDNLAATGIFTVPVNGEYRMSAQVQLTPIDNDRVILDYTLNGVSAERFTDSPSFNSAGPGELVVAGSAAIRASKDDTLAVGILHTHGSDVTARDVRTRLQITLARETWQTASTDASVTMRTSYAHDVSLWVF